MLFSIVMPSFMGTYPNCATNREEKFIRAVESVLKQTFEDWELVIIADGCKRTVELATPYFYEYLPKIRIIEIEKQKTWSGKIRNAGIVKAEGEIITYLDTDDYIGENHLKKINDGFGNYDWVFYNDFVWKDNAFIENPCGLTKGRCGTSNVSHKKSLNAYWLSETYEHDWSFIKILQSLSKNYTIIPAAEYMVCHRPGKFKYDI